MILVIAGMIGTGKSSVAKALGEEFKSEVFYESVEDNKILPLFYIIIYIYKCWNFTQTGIAHTCPVLYRYGVLITHIENMI